MTRPTPTASEMSAIVGASRYPGWIPGGSLAIRVALTKERGFPFVRAFLSGTRPRGRQHASGFIQHRLATVDLFVVANRLDRFRVSAGERFGDLLGRESVVARQRLAATHVAQLVEHDGPGFVSALIALNRGQLDLREPRELPGDLLLLEPVVGEIASSCSSGELVATWVPPPEPRERRLRRASRIFIYLSPVEFLCRATGAGSFLLLAGGCPARTASRSPIFCSRASGSGRGRWDWIV